MMAEPTEARGRDRARTQDAILAAARQVLAESGFPGFGINAVARQAGCDKQLIYRYFGGLDGLVEAIGDDLAAWVSASLAKVSGATPATYGELVERLMLGFLASFRSDILVQKIAAWEIADASPLMQRLSQARGKALAQWIASQRADLVPPAGVDAPAINAMLIAALQHLVLSASAMGQFGGMSLVHEEDWSRVEKAAVAIVRAIYQPD